MDFQPFTSDITIVYYQEAAFLLIGFTLLYILGRIIKIKLSLTAVKFFEMYLICVGFAFLGTTLGLFIGLSRSPVVGAFVPALLTFLSGIIAYFFVSKKEEFIPENRIVVTLNVLLLSFFLWIGSSVGADHRTKGELEEKYIDYQYRMSEKQFDANSKLFFEQHKNDNIPMEETKTISFDEVKEMFAKPKEENKKK